MKNEELTNCEECENLFPLDELKEIHDNLYCKDCSVRCAECNVMLNEETWFNKSFCSKECKDQYLYDLYEEDYK